jgi:hypothetical protein
VGEALFQFVQRIRKTPLVSDGDVAPD